MLSIVSAMEWDNVYNERYLVVKLTGSFTGSNRYNTTFTVKSHDNYKGEKSTKMSRPKITA